MAEPFQLPLFPDQAALIRIRPERNEWRYYRLAVWPDLFGRALLARQWVRIGTQGRVRLDPHPDAGAAINALARSPTPSVAAAIGIGLGDGTSTKAGHANQSTEGAALALPPGPRRPWTRHPKGPLPHPWHRPGALHRRRCPEIRHRQRA